MPRRISHLVILGFLALGFSIGAFGSEPPVFKGLQAPPLLVQRTLSPDGIEAVISEWEPKFRASFEKMNKLLLIGLGLGAAVGSLLLIAGPIFLIVSAFKQHIGWGITSVFGYLTLIWIPQLLFIIMRWKRAKNGFLMTLVGFVLVVAPFLTAYLMIE